MSKTKARPLRTAAILILLVACSACEKTSKEPRPTSESAPAMEAAPPVPSAMEPSGESAEEAAEFWETEGVTVNKQITEAKFLSEYNLFQDPKAQIPNADVLPYDLITPHFSDYARVRRFAKLPPDASATIQESGALDFPVGTMLVQTFSYLHDMRDPSLGEQLVETRVFMLNDDGWGGVSYRWNEDASDARRSVAGGIEDVAWIDENGQSRTLKYIVLNKNECKRCHENANKMLAIGPTMENLNREADYPEGPANQLTYWSEKGLLAGAPADLEGLPHLARWDDPTSGSVDARARAWLSVNCGHCHNPDGAGATSGLILSLHEDSPIRLGVYKPPVAAGRGSEGNRFSIEPGSPSTSFLVGRLRSEDPSVMMPPVGRRLPPEEAISLISEWIQGMHYDEAESQALIEKQREEYGRLKQLADEQAAAEAAAQ